MAGEEVVPGKGARLDLSARGSPGAAVNCASFTSKSGPA